MKHIATTTLPDGTTKTVNGFKKPTPTTAIHNHGIFYHSVERTDAANPITGFIILGVTLAVMGLIVKFLA
jgi:hypothetical protein